MKRTIILAGMLAMILIAAPAFGQVTIDFGEGTAGSGGTITSLGGGQYSASGISVGELTVSNDGSYNGTYYTYGACSSALGNTSAACFSYNTSTGLVTIIGGICDKGDTCSGGADTLVTTTTLVNGTGTSADILSVSASTSGFSISFTEPDTKAASLLTALGVPTNTSFVLMNADSQGGSSGSNTGPWTADSTDVQNVVATPEPASIMLLGTMLVGITQLIRRRSRSV